MASICEASTSILAKEAAIRLPLTPQSINILALPLAMYMALPLLPLNKEQKVIIVIPFRLLN
jgi:hypothetical protein